MTKPVVRHSTADDYEAIATLLDGVLGPKRRADRYALWRWRHDQHPMRRDGFPAFLIAEANGRVVGVHGVMPVRLKVGPRYYLSVCACDYAVAPDARSVGLRLKLEALKLAEHAFLLSCTANESALKLTKALGGSTVDAAATTFFSVVRARSVLKSWLPTRGPLVARATAFPWWLPAAVCADAIGSLLRAVRVARAPRGVTFAPVTSFDQSFDRLWERLASSHQIAVTKDRAYLDWRYGRYPFPGVHAFAATDHDGLCGLAVIQDARQGDVRCAYLAELLVVPGRPRLATALLAYATSKARALGADYVAARAADPVTLAALRDLRFIRRASDMSPYTFQNRSDASPELIDDASRWVVSYGDGDACFVF